MTSKEIVRRNIEFDNPERIAFNFFGHPEIRDFVNSAPAVKTKATDWKQVGDSRWERIDEYGNTWGRVEKNTKGEIVKGALSDIDEVYDYEFPDFSKIEDYERVKTAGKDNPDKWLNTGAPFTFTIARKMLKLDNYLMHLMLDLDKLRILHDKVDKMAEDKIRCLAESGSDSVMIAEDWGTQDRTLISPDLFKKEFLPRYKKLVGLTHDLGMKFIMHSCGCIAEFMPYLIEAGVDVFQFDQAEVHGLDKLASYQEIRNVTYWCPIDVQKVLQTKDEKIIRAKAREMIEKLWQGRGGFIASIYNDNASLGLEPKWQEIAIDEFVKNCKGVMVK
ncbi:MAG: uroporphyrinogen decarboxylase family protein [Planctomycetota bacterium]|jgi:hypothetical protein